MATLSPLRAVAMCSSSLLSLAVASVLVAVPALAQEPAGAQQPDGADPNRITDEYIPMQVDGFPSRPHPIFELGNTFLGTGPLAEAWRSPTGQFLTPTILAWGTMRSGLAILKRGNNRDRADWANRFDLFLEGRLSPTERVVVGFRPLDKDGVFTGYDFEGDRSRNGFNFDLQTAFFEGDFGEIFPGLEREDNRALDFGFGIGRQPVNWQDGIMINDRMDAVTITRNSLRFLGMSNFLVTGLIAWNEINLGNGAEDPDAFLAGVMTASDFEFSYIQADVVMLRSSRDSSGDGLFVGLGATQRIGAMNSTFRINTSFALDDPDPRTGTPAVASGVLLTSQLSWVPHHTADNAYFNAFAAFDEYTSASRDPATGGPLGGTGVLFAATGLGAVGAPISNRARDALGGAVGYQQFFNHGEQQVIYELGARFTTENIRQDNTVGVGVRFQTAWGQRAVFLVDVFAGYDEADDGFYGGRCECLWKF